MKPSERIYQLSSYLQRGNPRNIAARLHDLQAVVDYLDEQHAKQQEPADEVLCQAVDVLVPISGPATAIVERITLPEPLTLREGETVTLLVRVKGGMP